MNLYPAGTPMHLAEGTRILLNGRVGEVYRSSAIGCELVWEEFTDFETGEVVSAIADKLTSEQVSRSLSRGHLKILSLPSHLAVRPPERAAAAAPRPAELARASWRECYVLAAQKLIERGELHPFRADFERNVEAIVRIGLAEDLARGVRKNGERRAGQDIVVKKPPKNGKAVFNWWKAVKAHGSGQCFDNYRDCGRTDDRYSDEVVALMREVVDVRLTEERPTISSILESVRSRFRLHNANLKAADPAAEDWPIPGYGSVWALIARIAPIDHKVRTRGMEKAYNDLHTLGKGLMIDRVLQRVELDEYTLDLMVLLRLLKLDKLLTPGEKVALGLTGQAIRVVISAAIDVFSGAIVAMQIAVAGSMNLTVKTIEMIYFDKTPIAKAAEAANPWPMHGHPQVLALDRAAVNMSDEIYLRLAAAGITNLAVPSGKPFLKPWIERFFATMGATFLQQFTGRTFSNVVLKGENDPAKRATLNLDEFLQWLVRWIVDVHHTTKPDTLGRAAPLFAWERAVAEIPPLVLNDESRLRKAFGDRVERLVSRHGVEVKGLFYVAPEISEWFLNESDRNLEVWWWHKRIGRVEVLLPNGRWVTAHCTDERWIDKSYDDLAVFVAQDNSEKERGQEARDRYRVEADARTAELAKLRGLLPLAPSEEDRAARTKEFTRHMRPHGTELGPSQDLFDDPVTPFNSPASAPAQCQDDSVTARIRNRRNPGDIME